MTPPRTLVELQPIGTSTDCGEAIAGALALPSMLGVVIILLVVIGSIHRRLERFDVCPIVHWLHLCPAP